MAGQREPIPARDVQARTRNGRFLWLSVSTIAIPSAWRELSSLVHLFRDITLRKQLERNVSNLFETSAQLSEQPPHPRLQEPSPPGGELTPRENEVLQELATGAGTRELAAMLFITEATARNHIHKIISKLGVHNRLEAVTLALRSGML